MVTTTLMQCIDSNVSLLLRIIRFQNVALRYTANRSNPARWIKKIFTLNFLHSKPETLMHTRENYRIMKTKTFLLRFYVWHKSNTYFFTACSRTIWKAYICHAFQKKEEEKNSTKTNIRKRAEKSETMCSINYTQHIISLLFLHKHFFLFEFHCIQTRNAHLVFVFVFQTCAKCDLVWVFLRIGCEFLSLLWWIFMICNEKSTKTTNRNHTKLTGKKWE